MPDGSCILLLQENTVFIAHAPTQMSNFLNNYILSKYCLLIPALFVRQYGAIALSCQKYCFIKWSGFL